MKLSLKTVAKNLTTAYNDFGFRLFAQLARQDASQNLFISPFSIALALTLTYNGAAHETQQAMAEALDLNQLSLADVNTEAAAMLAALADPDPQIQLAIANSLWTKLSWPFKPEFIARGQNFYRAEVQAIDFTAPEAAPTINAWVKDKTHDKIDQIIQASNLDPPTTLILINALYFKGKWTRPFDAQYTRAQSFFLLDGSIKQCPLMSQSGEYRYYEDERAQIVSLPYGAERISLIIALPKPELAFHDFQAALTEPRWQHWLSQLKSQAGTVVLPRFKAEYSQELKATLTALGMGLAFSQTQADFSQMSDRPSYINLVFHKTFLEVNEEGTEAAAVTAVVMQARGMPLKQRFTLRVDRPFFCAIVDQQTGAILFMGSIVDPASM